MKKHFLIPIFFCLVATFVQAQMSENVELVYHWEDSTLVSSFAHDNTYNEIWGYTKDGKEYAIIGSTYGTHIFDVTNPAMAEEILRMPGEVQGATIIHRDYHDYQDYLYAVCDEGPSTLQIFDLSHLPDSAPKVYDSNALFNRSHNIFIDSAAAKMYSCGGDGELFVFSLNDPLNPTLLVDCGSDVPFWNGLVGYVHDIFVRNDTAYCNAATRGLFVVDFSDTPNPVVIGSLTEYPQKGYNHSGWLNGAGSVYAMADETHGMEIKILNTSDPTDIIVEDTINSEINPLSIPHNLIIHNGYLHVSHYHDGYYLFDLSDPSNVTIAGYFDTSEETHTLNYRGAWGIYPFLPSGNVLVSDMQNGLYVFDVSQAITSVTLEKKKELELSIYPNPFVDQVTLLNLSSKGARVEYQIHTTKGDIVQSGSLQLTGFSRETLNLADLPQGLYLLNLVNGQQFKTMRLLKMNR